MTDWVKEWSKAPCNSCRLRWPNKRNPDAKVGDGCDGIGCTERPDLEYLYEPKVNENGT